MTVTTRFAPSPTGYLHIGSARTALYSWLYAKANNGTFILRIEDTDVERSTQEAVTVILEGMSWLGLNYQMGPIFQTDRFPRYQEVVKQLLAAGKAYRCYCSKEKLLKIREEQMANKQKPRYDGYCREHELTEQNQPYVIRFKNPESGTVTFQDQVRGPITFENSELDDLVIVRSDGVPTYNFTVVIDDMDMKVSHVIRGDDHIANTPRQINIFEALGATPPVYGHLPMILGADGKRLSKRHGAISVLQYRDEGYLPEALLNYLVRLGWSHGDQEIFSQDEMVRYFSMDHISHSPATFNIEKLLWLNHHYLKNSPPTEIAKHLAWHLDRLHIDYHKGPALEEIVIAQRDRAKTLVEMADRSRFLFEDTVTYDEASVAKELLYKGIFSVYELMLAKLKQVTDWNPENIHQQVIAATEELGVKIAKIAQPLRIAATGSVTSPSIDVTLSLLGKEKTIRRIEATIAMLKNRQI